MPGARRHGRALNGTSWDLAAICPRQQRWVEGVVSPQLPGVQPLFPFPEATQWLALALIGAAELAPHGRLADGRVIWNPSLASALPLHHSHEGSEGRQTLKQGRIASCRVFSSHAAQASCNLSYSTPQRRFRYQCEVLVSPYQY